jgi:hypothetical protein
LAKFFQQPMGGCSAHPSRGIALRAMAADPGTEAKDFQRKEMQMMG